MQIAPHQSRWDYPKELAVIPGTQIHYVVKGDTLWDLGTKYLGNPFAWPQIWELNKWVKDPHWIYPGDPLLVDGSRAGQAQPGNPELAPAEVADLQPDIRRIAKPTRDEYAYSFQDFIQLPFLAEQGAEAYIKKTGAVRLVGRQDATKVMHGDGDVIYLAAGSNQGFKAGDRLVTFITQQKRFYHPNDKNHRRSMGDVLQQTGVVRITKAYATQSVAIIERCLDGVLLGEYAAPFTEPANIVASLRTDIGNPIQEKDPVLRIIYLREGKAVGAGGDLALVDQGSKDGLKVGERLLLYRARPLDDHPAAKAPKATTNFYMGQAVVVRTEEKTATCRILRANTEILIGDCLTR